MFLKLYKLSAIKTLTKIVKAKCKRKEYIQTSVHSCHRQFTLTWNQSERKENTVCYLNILYLVSDKENKLNNHISGLRSRQDQVYIHVDNCPRFSSVLPKLILNCIRGMWSISCSPPSIISIMQLVDCGTFLLNRTIVSSLPRLLLLRRMLPEQT